MHANLNVPVSTVVAFVLVLARISGAFVFVPLPVKDAGPGMARVVLCLGATLALFPAWPHLEMADVSIGVLAAWMASEAALGLTIGVCVSFLAEALLFGAHVVALQAGYGYVAIVDPTTQAESDVLPVIAQLLAGLLFFAAGLHRTVIASFAYSLKRYPPGTFKVSQTITESVIRLSGTLFSVGLRLALPVIGLLLMAEIALALTGRIQSQLHASMHAFPLKIMIALLTLVSVLAVAPGLYSWYAERVFGVVRSSVLR